MATLRKRGGRWQAQVRRKGRQSVTRSFLLKTDAEAWGRQQELEADRLGLPTAHKGLRGVTVADVVIRYRDEIVPRKRAGDRETHLLNAFLRHPLAKMALSDVTTGAVSAYCAERLQSVKPSSVNRELDILRHAFRVARQSWDIPLVTNAFAEVTRPKGGAPRERRLEPSERERLLRASQKSRNQYIRFLVELALETAMRRGELLRGRVDRCLLRQAHTAYPGHQERPRTDHSAHGRSFGAAAHSLRQRSDDLHNRILPISENSARLAWNRLVRRARVEDLRFHDLRHEAISRFFEIGLNVPEVALISGHSDPRMFFRYTHPKAELIAHKLR